MKRKTIAKGLAAAAAGAMALGLAGASAQAQPYGQYGYYGGGYYGGYDPCQREANSRGIGGALVGGGIGAVIGSQVAANHHRSDGSLVGGALGALIGAGVGHSSAACQPGYAPPPPPPPPPAAYNEYAPYGDEYGYDRGYRYEGRYDDGDWAYGGRGERYRIAGRVGADGCTLAESPIYLPDGRVQKRFVRVCMDSDGRYQVVD